MKTPTPSSALTSARVGSKNAARDLHWLANASLKAAAADAIYIAARRGGDPLWVRFSALCALRAAAQAALV